MRMANSWVIAFLVFICACRDSNRTDSVTKDAQRIAKMQCVSRELTGQKFRLANEYRKLDQLQVEGRITAVSAESVRKQLDQKKNLLVAQAQERSDELLHLLRQLWKDKYQTKESRTTLDSLTELHLQKNCTLASP